MAAKVKKDAKGRYWVIVHHAGKRRKKLVGKDRRLADRVAKEIQARLTLGEYAMEPEPTEDPIPFAAFAEQWLRREVEIPLERGLKGHLSHGTARVYRLQVDTHLAPNLGEIDIRQIGLREVQALYDHFLDIGRPKSAKSIDMAMNVLRLVLNHARGQGLIASNPVEAWKQSRPKRRRSESRAVPPEKVLTAEELDEVLSRTRSRFRRYYPLMLFLADTGARFGEAAALRWSDIDLDGGTAEISRSFSSGVRLGPTKTGRSRVVELSGRLRDCLAETRPNVEPMPLDLLAFGNMHGGFLQGTNFRSKVFNKVIAEALGEGRRHSPHSLRHTWASLHMARGTPIKWIQAQGGWTTANLLLDTYGHFMPSESGGYADALSAASNGPQAALIEMAAEPIRAVGSLSPRNFKASEILVDRDRPQIPDHALHGTAAFLEELGDVDGQGVYAAVADLA